MATKDNKPEAAKPEGAETPAPRSGRKMWIIIAAAVLLAAGVTGAGAWYFLKHKAPAHAAAADDEDEHDEAAPRARAGGSAEKPHAFVHLEPFTTNLADEGGERVAQVTVNVELAEPTMQERLNQLLPVVRNQILFLISSRDSSSLLTIAGKNQLADEMALRIGMTMGWEPPEPVDDIADLPRNDGKARVGADKSAEKPAEKSVEKPADKGVDKGADKASDRDADPASRSRKKKRSRRAAPNPVVGVHFEQFIVQ